MRPHRVGFYIVDRPSLAKTKAFLSCPPPEVVDTALRGPVCSARRQGSQLSIAQQEPNLLRGSTCPAGARGYNRLVTILLAGTR